MRQIGVWIEDGDLCGFRVVLEVVSGRKHAVLLHVPTLTRLRLSTGEIEAQLRRGLAREIPIRRGAARRLLRQRRQWKAWGRRFSETLVRRALAGLEGAGGRTRERPSPNPPETP